MLGNTQKLLVYYLGGGFVVLLGWGACVPDRQLDSHRARRYLRWAAIAAVAGLLQPAVTLAARDIVAQVGIDIPEDAPLAQRHARTTFLVNLMAALSALPVMMLLAVGLT